MPEVDALPEPLYTAIGQMTVAAAKLEWQVASCVVVIGEAPNAEAALGNPVSRNIDTLHKWLRNDGRVDDSLRTLVGGWLGDSRRALDERNKIVHSVTVWDLGEDKSVEVSLYHPRSRQLHVPSADDIDKLTEELLTRAGVGLKRSSELAELVGYSAD